MKYTDEQIAREIENMVNVRTLAATKSKTAGEALDIVIEYAFMRIILGQDHETAYREAEKHIEVGLFLKDKEAPETGE